METHGRVEVQPLREESDQLHAPEALLPDKLQSVPILQGLIGPQSLSGTYGEEKNLLPFSLDLP
jgi:hypothetical protein